MVFSVHEAHFCGFLITGNSLPGFSIINWSLSKQKKLFFLVFQFLKRVFSEFSLLELIFLTFPWKKSISVIFLSAKFSLMDFSWMKIFFGIFNNETDFNGFPVNIFSSWNYQCGWLVSVGFWFFKIDCHIFPIEFLPLVFLDKISSDGFPFDEVGIVVCPFQRVQFLRFFLPEVVFLVFLMNKFVLDGLPIKFNWFIRASNQFTGSFKDAQSTSIQFSPNEFFKELISTLVFPWTLLSKENWTMSFLSADVAFQGSSIVDKKFRGLPMDKNGSSGVLMVQVSFHKISVNYIKFHRLFSKETSFLALHLYENVSPGVPVSEVDFVFVSPLMRAVSLDSSSKEQTSTNFPSKKLKMIDLKPIQFIPIDYFSGRSVICGFLINETDFQGNIIHKSFSISFTSTLFSQEFPNDENVFSVFSTYQNEFSRKSRWWCCFSRLTHGLNQFQWFI